MAICKAPLTEGYSVFRGALSVKGW